jgi:hypothetical protein
VCAYLNIDPVLNICAAKTKNKNKNEKQKNKYKKPSTGFTLKK